jgi:hypothetical protein
MKGGDEEEKRKKAGDEDDDEDDEDEEDSEGSDLEDGQCLLCERFMPLTRHHGMRLLIQLLLPPPHPTHLCLDPEYPKDAIASVNEYAFPRLASVKNVFPSCAV